MRGSLLVLASFAAFSLSAASLHAQDASPAGPSWQSQPAPIQRQSPPDDSYGADGAPGQDYGAQPMPHPHRHRPVMSQPAQGIYIVSDRHLQPVATGNNASLRTELRLDRGRANITVDHPKSNELILIDLPGGQADLLKDGFYTLNANDNTLRVLHGEADVFAPGASPDSHGVKVREGEQVVLGAGAHPSHMNADEARADLIPPPRPPAGAYGQGSQGYGQGYGEPGYPGVYGAPYGYYGYPYGYPYAWGWPYYGYGWGWPYWGYPYWGWGLGFGWGWGGWYGGIHPGWGYRGGFAGRGFAGGGFHGGGFGGGFHGGGGGGRR